MMVQLESAAVRIAEGLGAEVIVSWDFLDSGFESGLESDPPH